MPRNSSATLGHMVAATCCDRQGRAHGVGAGQCQTSVVSVYEGTGLRPVPSPRDDSSGISALRSNRVQIWLGQPKRLPASAQSGRVAEPSTESDQAQPGRVRPVRGRRSRRAAVLDARGDSTGPDAGRISAHSLTAQGRLYQAVTKRVLVFVRRAPAAVQDRTRQTRRPGRRRGSTSASTAVATSSGLIGFARNMSKPASSARRSLVAPA
jgi:hypothetical protein